jgi:hypothetical protein
VLAVPHIATASPKKPVSVPDCSDFSAGRLAALLHLHQPLRFDGGTHRTDESTCSWLTPRQPGRYRDLLQLAITATPVAVFDAEKRAARQEAARSGADFGTLEVPGAAMAFSVDQYFSNRALPPCKPGYKLEAYGPPMCFPEPDWAEITVATYGRVKPRGPRAFVKVALAAQEYTPNPAFVSPVNKEILSGQLR